MIVPRLLVLLLLLACTQQCIAGVDTVKLNKYINAGEEKMLSAPDSGIYYGEEVLKISSKENFVKGEIIAHNIIGMSLWAKGSFTEGSGHLQEMVKLAKKIKDTGQLATAYGNLGILYIDMGDLDMGLQHNLNAVALYNLFNDKASAALYHNNIGWIYEEKKNYDSALLYYTRAKDWYERNEPDNAWYGMLLSNIGSVYVGLNQPKEALEYAQEGLAAFKDSSNKKALGHIYLNLSEAFLANKKHRSAINHANMAIDIAERHSIYTLYPDANWFLYQAYKDAGNKEAALKHFELNKAWTDTMLNEETYKKLTAAQTAIATEEKDKLIALKEREVETEKAEKQRNMTLLILAIIGGVILAAISYLIYKRQRKKIQTTEEELETEQQERELATEKSEDLQKELDIKQQELLTYTLSMTQKNAILQELDDQVGNLDETTDKKEVRKIRNNINAAMSAEENWEEFKVRFESVHHSFFDNLKKDYPKLSGNDLRLAAFVRLSLTSKQVASLLGIAPSSVDMSKYRLKKKLGLEKEDNISDVIDRY